MQIHDITKRARRTDEGLLDGIKSAIGAAKTGYNAGGAAGVAKALTSPSQFAVAQNQTALNAAEKSRQAINKKYGWTGTDKEIKPGGAQRGADEMFAGQKQDTELKKQAADLTQQFVTNTNTAPIFAELSAVLPDPGQMLTVAMNNSNYYKDEKGTWYAEAESNMTQPQPITTAAAVQKLNDIIDTDQYKQVPSIFGKAVQPTAATKGVQKTSATAPATPIKEAVGKGIGKKSALALAKQTAMKQANNSIVAKKYRTSASQATKNATVAQQIAQAEKQLASASASKLAKGKKQKVKQAYQNLTYVTLKGMQQIGSGQVSQDKVQPGQELPTNAATTPASPLEIKSAQQQLIQQGADPKALSAMEKMVQQGKGEIIKQAVGLDENLKSLDQQLLEALNLLNENQVYITKDIVVKTALGNYTKSHIDQTWYDPNGVPIDPVKYADYVKKLDATPAAQTRYQVDSKNSRGSDTAVVKQQAVNKSIAQAPRPSTTPAAPDPLQQIADQQKMAAILRNRDVTGLNSMINDTFNQLQNAKIFNTGQEDYLKDRMAALMAMKA